MITAHTAAASAGLLTCIGRLVAGLTTRTGIAGMIQTSAIGTGVGAIAVETVGTRSRVVGKGASTTATGIGGAYVAVITIFIDRANSTRLTTITRLVTGLTARAGVSGM
jgi:hypothetical protein